jgi:hypothetical protein
MPFLRAKHSTFEIEVYHDYSTTCDATGQSETKHTLILVLRLGSHIFFPPDPKSARIASLLAQLPRLLLPDDEKPLDKFALFPKLVPEIRNKIWKFAASQPEASDISPCMRDGQPNFWTSHYPPAILSTSKEARREGLRFYDACTIQIRDWERLGLIRTLHSKVHYINFDRHVIIKHLDHGRFNIDRDSAYKAEDLAKIQEITIKHTGYQPQGFHLPTPDLLGLLSYTKSIRTLSFVISNWCAAAGVHQGIAQELYRKEIHDSFEKYLKVVCKDAGVQPQLNICFRDWNDSDAAPCSADPEKGCGKRYFSPAAANWHC